MTTDRDYIEFVKMHGAGNDYVYIVGIPENCPITLPDLAVRISDRHYGIGGDGLIVVLPSDKADFKMRMFNADGSEAQMCGNASRCIAKLVYEKGLTDKPDISLETLSGIKFLHLNLDSDGYIDSVTVNMGSPVVEAEKIPVVPGMMDNSGLPAVALDERNIAFAVSMGNPHGVIFTEDLSDAHVIGRGKAYEFHEAWPEKANIEFVKILDTHHVRMRVWERGSGETLACGTGACATVVAGILREMLASPVTVSLPGGELTIEWAGIGADVMMTGPAETVAEGRYFFKHYR